MKRPVLSICIASYNKAGFTGKLVNTILGGCSNDKLNVVVVDNASTDDTVEKLSTITDSRFSLIRNDKNIGGAANMVRAIYSGGTASTVTTGI